MHNREVSCTLRSFLKPFCWLDFALGCTLQQSLTLLWDAHHRVWLCCGMHTTTESDAITPITEFLEKTRNNTLIHFIARGPDGLKSWKTIKSLNQSLKWCDTPFLIRPDLTFLCVAVYVKNFFISFELFTFSSIYFLISQKGVRMPKRDILRIGESC